MRALLIAVLVMFFAAAPAHAAPPPVDLIHSENVQVGPYELKASFSEWPIRADRSLDFTFVPDGDITGHQGHLTLVGPDVRGEQERLARHPRARDQWGLDIRALPAQGVWRLEFAIDGPKGKGQGFLAVPVGPRPGPPAALSWTVGLGPLIIGVIAAAVAWARRRRSATRPNAWTWG